MKFALKFALTLIVALCTIVACFSLWGFWAAFEPGQQRWLVIYPIAFVTAAAIGVTAQGFLRKL